MPTQPPPSDGNSHNPAPSLPRTNRVGRPADRQDVIVTALRQRIVSGELGPGQVLPTRLDLERDFAASTMTVQRALERLKRAGFVVANRGNGTFVAPRPPHLTRYPLVFPTDPQRAWLGFYAAIACERESLSGQEVDIPLFYGVNGHQQGHGYHDLVSTVLEKRLAGIIFASLPINLQDTPLFLEPALPRVIIGSSDAGTGYPFVRTDTDSYWQKALAAIAARGKHNVAFMVPPGLTHERRGLEELAGSLGLKTRPHWWQVSHQSTPESAYQSTLLLFHREQPQVPDALIISDDNLVEATTAALSDAGAHGTVVVAHANFPLRTETAVPVLRLGFPARQVLTTCLELLQRQRLGLPCPRETALPALLESELQESTSVANASITPPEMAAAGGGFEGSEARTSPIPQK